MILVRKEPAMDSCLISRNSQPLEFRPSKPSSRRSFKRFYASDVWQMQPAQATDVDAAAAASAAATYQSTCPVRQLANHASCQAVHERHRDVMH